ncbi:MAG: ATP phosphoribosyltransferase [Microscillaceae bacterium]|nr:ATP phosphoribosyltransferase [Microscillaceae bacterium]
MDIRLRLAIQKSGRLSEGSLELVRECGVSFTQAMGKLKADSHNFPLEFLFLRDDDIPKYVANGIADIGIVGENVLVEKAEDVEMVEKLGFSKCRLSIAVPKEHDFYGVEDLEGLKIATSYPRLLQAYLDQEGIKAEIHEISGSVEIAPSIGLADAVCDIVSSGSTLISNGLKEVLKIFKSEAVLIANKQMLPERQEILEQLLFRIHAVKKAGNFKYILMNVPNDAIAKVSSILPVMKSPSVMPLAMEGWSSLHSVVNEDEFWKVIEQLKAAGAEGILVIPIEKMIS